jgi:hypothetical protein
MGTNYYLINESDKPHCGTCGCFARLHIGKSSAGWCFSLHVVPERGVNSLDDWRRKFAEPGKVIVSEYDKIVSAEEMLDCITNRNSLNSGAVPFGYGSWAEFHADNDSEPGPRGLLRHRIGPHCAGHGEGTWDLVAGEFS